MIARRTVILLGAGASRGYGYPSGRELMTGLTRATSDHISMIDRAGQSGPGVGQFQTRLHGCGLNSVDAFLQRNPIFSGTAKIRIAQELSRHEAEATSSRTRTESWCQYFFSEFLDTGSLDTLGQNRCVFVTLNYDRVLEYEMTTMLINAYGATWEQAAKAFQSIPVIHLHGSIGTLPGFGKHAVSYGAIVEPEQVMAAAGSILTLGEAGSEKAYDQASEAIRDAELIVSLGFGFHAEVIRRLGLNELGTGVVRASCQGMTQSEVSGVATLFGPRDFLELLRDPAQWSTSPRVAGPAVDYLRANVQFFR